MIKGIIFVVLLVFLLLSLYNLTVAVFEQDRQTKRIIFKHLLAGVIVAVLALLISFIISLF